MRKAANRVENKVLSSKGRCCCRMAAARFGASTAVRLATILAPIANPARLAEVGDWLVRGATGGEFLSRVDPPSRS